MDFVVRKADLIDLPEVMRVIREAAVPIASPDWFSVPDEKYMEAQLRGEGFILAAETPEGVIAGIFEVDFPGMGEDNLGRDVGLFEEQLPKVAHMDLAAVVPGYRGNKLHSKLLAEAEKEVTALGYRHLLCTVHPDNCYSLSNFVGLGYSVAATSLKYGGRLRHILYKSNGPILAALHYPGLDEFLLSLPGAQKDYKAEWQWLRYQVGSKLFVALCTPGLEHGRHGGRTMLILKCDPMLAELYREQYEDVVPGFYSDKRNWNSVYLDAGLPADLVFIMCRHAYERTLSKLPKKVQREIQG